MSFIRALFDFSFSEFITTKIIKLLYILTIIIAALVWLGFMVAMFSSNSGIWGVLAGLIGAPIGFAVQVIFTRVGYEILIVVFGIAEHTRDMAWALTGGRKAPPRNSCSSGTSQTPGSAPAAVPPVSAAAGAPSAAAVPAPAAAAAAAVPSVSAAAPAAAASGRRAAVPAAAPAAETLTPACSKKINLG